MIKQSIAALADDEWPEIELTLDTFGAGELSRRAGWSSNSEYALMRLRGSDDDVLVKLHAHLHPDISVGISPTAGGPWEKDYVKLFLTHTHPNKVLAKGVRERLLVSGVDAFVAHEMIEPTKDWQEEIEFALATCEALAAIVTEDLLNSKYCDQEIGYAMGRGLVVIPVRQGADPHGFFAKYQGVPGSESIHAAWHIADGILDALIKNPKTKGKMGPSIVRRYATSQSFDRARENTQYLIDMPKELWTIEMVEQVERAGTLNSQLGNGVWIETQQRIPDFVREHLDDLLDRKSKPARAELFELPDFVGTVPDDISVWSKVGRDG